MGFLEVLFTGVALSMDACVVGMTNGMTDSKMRLKKILMIAAFFGFFQFLMPLIGYYLTGIISGAFQNTFEKISSWISFILLGFLGGKMIFEFVKCRLLMKKATSGETETAEPVVCEVKKLTIGQLCMQAIATSIDALAIGVVMQFEGLALGVWVSTGIIGITTFVLSIAAVYIGKLIGDKLADQAGLFGGVILVAIGLKILIEGLL